jgi:hypothetical protein
MSPDEIFEIAERAAEADQEVAGHPLSSHAGEVAVDALASYRQMVERVTEVLTDQLELPAFDDWLNLYRSRPAEVDAQLLGFWKEAAREG